jgi:hypothetical protein
MVSNALVADSWSANST